MTSIKNKKSFNKNIIVLSLGLALSACGGSSDDKVIDKITNSAPTISSSASTTVESGTAYNYLLVAADADADTLTMSAANLPTWLSFDASTGVLSGTPADSDEGDIAITLTVSDGTDNITQSFTVSVTVPAAINNAAVITSTGVTSATVGEAYSYTLTATDADSDTLTMSTTIPGTLSWLTFDDTTGILSGIPASGDVAATEITLAVNDGTDNALQTFTITVATVEPTPALVVYEDAENPLWPAWDCCGGTTPSVISDSDADYDQVTQFNIVGDTVVGFNARDAVDGVAFDTPAGTTLEFDLKVTAMPTAGDTDWMLKLEGGGVSEVNLNTSVEGIAPTIDTWVHYTFNVADLGLTSVDLIMMFPAFGTGDGAEYSIDNVQFYSNQTPPPVISETPALIVYEDAENPLWPAWDCCGGTTPSVISDSDADYDQVTQFNIVGGTVVGFNARDAVDGVAFETPAGTILEFDLKVTAMPTAGDTDWMLKLEGGGVSEVNLNTSVEGVAPILDTWVHYTFNVADLGLTSVDLIMMFPAFGTGDGAQFSIDNVSFSTQETDPDPVSETVGGIADIGDYGFVANGGFEDGITGWGEENAMISVEVDDLGTQLVKIIAPEAQNPFVKQAKIGEGAITPGQALTVSFDMKGTADGDGGIVNALLFTEASSGVSKTDNLMTVPPTADWTHYSFDVTAGTDTEWGVALLLQPACGAVAGCKVTAYFDNISITTTP
jgi:hypothetical protein